MWAPTRGERGGVGTAGGWRGRTCESCHRTQPHRLVSSSPGRSPVNVPGGARAGQTRSAWWGWKSGGEAFSRKRRTFFPSGLPPLLPFAPLPSFPKAPLVVPKGLLPAGFFAVVLPIVAVGARDVNAGRRQNIVAHDARRNPAVVARRRDTRFSGISPIFLLQGPPEDVARAPRDLARGFHGRVSQTTPYPWLTWSARLPSTRTFRPRRGLGKRQALRRRGESSSRLVAGWDLIGAGVRRRAAGRDAAADAEFEASHRRCRSFRGRHRAATRGEADEHWGRFERRDVRDRDGEGDASHAVAGATAHGRTRVRREPRRGRRREHARQHGIRGDKRHAPDAALRQSPSTRVSRSRSAALRAAPVAIT